MTDGTGKVPVFSQQFGRTQGTVFCAPSNPFQYIGDGSYYGDELQFLADAGFSFVEEAEGLWHAIR